MVRTAALPTDLSDTIPSIWIEKEDSLGDYDSAKKIPSYYTKGIATASFGFRCTGGSENGITFSLFTRRTPAAHPATGCDYAVFFKTHFFTPMYCAD